MSAATATAVATSPPAAAITTTTVQVEVGDSRTIILTADALVSSTESVPSPAGSEAQALPRLEPAGGGRRKQAKPQKNKNGEKIRYLTNKTSPNGSSFVQHIALLSEHRFIIQVLIMANFKRTKRYI